jgi:DNA repair exonuclease SbcCD ATPase subunit
MRFTSLHIEGFCSITKKQVVKFSNKGLVVLQGSNGAGKTQIFSALMWAISGKTLKEDHEVVPNAVIYPKYTQGTCVILNFTENGNKYSIRRTEEYKPKGASKKESNLTLTINGTPFPQGKVETKKEIEKIIGMGPMLFKNSIIFPQRHTPITRADQADKKAIFNEAFEVYYIKLAKEKAEARKKEIEASITPIQGKINSYQHKIQLVEDKIGTIQKLIAAFESEKSEKIAKLRLALLESKSNKRKLGIINEDILKTKDAIKVCRSALSKAPNEDISDLKVLVSETKIRLASSKQLAGTIDLEIKEVADKIKNFSKNCSVCGSKLKPEIIEKELGLLKTSMKEKKAQLTRIEELIEKHESVLDNKQAEYASKANKVLVAKEHRERLQKLESTLSKLELEKYRASQERKTRLDLKARITEEKSRKLKTQKISTYENRIEIYKGKQEKLEAKKQAVLAELELYHWVLSKPLSNQGLSSYIFETMLQAVNNRLKYYSTITGIRLKFSVNLSSSRKEFKLSIYHGNAMKLYGNLSGGEAQLIDISAALAINDVVSQNKRLNILILDEVFEGLDEDNIEIVYNLLQDKARTKNIWLVTHNKHFIRSNSEVVKVIRTKSGTVLE